MYGNMARELFTAASQLNDPSGTLMIVKVALKYAIPVPSSCLSHLKRMVKNKNYAAMYVEGQIFEGENQNLGALDMYTESLRSATEGNQGAEAFDITLGEVWTAIYRMKSQKDKIGAYKAIKKAALEYDEPSAYYLLARDYIPHTSEEYKDYMLKAAASGELRAVDALGHYYLAQSQGIQPYSSVESINGLVKKLAEEAGDTGQAGEGGETADVGQAGQVEEPKESSKSFLTSLQDSGKRIKELEQALEWFQLGAEAKITSSQVHLALILHYKKKSSEGLSWLEKARDNDNNKNKNNSNNNNKRWSKTISWIEKHWDSNRVDFRQINIETLRLCLDGRNAAATATATATATAGQKDRRIDEGVPARERSGPITARSLCDKQKKIVS